MTGRGRGVRLEHLDFGIKHEKWDNYLQTFSYIILLPFSKTQNST